jgi:hypothetical protein
VGFTERQEHTNGYLQTVGLQHGLEIVADNGWPVGLVGEKMDVVRRQLDIENNQNGCEQYRNFQGLVFKGLGLFFLVEFVIFGGVVTAAFMFFIPVGITMVAAGLARSGLGMLAVFRFRKHAHVLQFFLAKMFAQGKAGRAEQHRHGEDNM